MRISAKHGTLYMGSLLLTPLFPPKKSSPGVELPGMPFHFAVRITQSFSDLSGVVRAWALKADRMIIYEHVGNETEKVHIHLLMLGVSVDSERLKQLAAGASRNLGKGNEFWSFKTKTKKCGPVSPSNCDKFITYMSKGKLEPMYNQGWEPTDVARLRAAWVDAAPSRTEILIDSFYDFLCKQKEGDYADMFHLWTPVIHDNVANVKILQSWARSWAFGYHSRVWTVRTASDAKMVFLTYCMREDITIPQDVKYW